jgi:hypothetical protein
MSEEASIGYDRIDISHLEASCYDLRRAIADLPRGVMHEHLLVSVLKVSEHLQKRHFILMKRTVLSMREMIGIPRCDQAVFAAWQHLQTQLALFLKQQHLSLLEE